jgi:hypothetical protein
MTTLICAPRARQRILDVVAELAPETNPRYVRRDVTGDGIPETWCNLFVREFLALLEVVTPALLANDLFEWLGAPAGKIAGWVKVDGAEAQKRADLGFPTIGVWSNTTGHGHVVAIVPAVPPTTPGIFSAQAGFKNWSHAPIERAGLRASAYGFFTHD